MYTHHELKFLCDRCEKKFPFASDRDGHAVQHENECKYRCKMCSKSFFMKGDLKKHEEVHKNIVSKCSLCDYETTDVQNLKAHQRVHSNLKHYICTYCLELFRYHMQWKHHINKPCPEMVKTEHDGHGSDQDKKQDGSKSPEY